MSMVISNVQMPSLTESASVKYIMIESSCGAVAKMSLMKNIPSIFRMMLNKLLVVMFWFSVFIAKIPCWAFVLLINTAVSKHQLVYSTCYGVVVSYQVKAFFFY